MAKTTYGVTLDHVVVDRLDDEANKEGRSRSSMLNRILTQRYGDAQ